MSTLVPISTPSASLQSDAEHSVRSLPVVVLSPHNTCNCRCVMCDIWKIREKREIAAADLERHLVSFRELGVRWVVLSGGEPLMHSHFDTLARMLRSQDIRVTLLTAGLLLQAQAESIARAVDDVIVSLDGPPAIHDAVRRIPGASERITAGIKAVRQFRPDMSVLARCTVQRANHRSLCATVTFAKETGFDSISFLAADVASTAFNRPTGWPSERQEGILLSQAEVQALEAEVQRLIREHAEDLRSAFVVETADKLGRIVHHFRAHLGQVRHIAPRCNAPWVSAVIEATGEVRPCFFHPPLGNIHDQTLQEIVNGPAALRFRRDLDIATNPICGPCVCSLYIPPHDKLVGGGPAITTKPPSPERTS